ncbi:Nramp family divalent metal transporter [Kineosporia mesophila]|uniref:Nramp family divalent metal transporter n=1 Tax=Kineosporia mesophila TaxID=566012 RepID=A0ABP6ZD06_9ACTN|nr:Nramp family divalent metal transporter [Kineosporia mesophila]
MHERQITTAVTELRTKDSPPRSRRPIPVVAALGPAFVAAIAYVDPGNFATNFQAGASTGYQLVWVLVLANLVAMPIQFLSAKLGVVTGKSLPHLCRERLPRPVAFAMWAQAEVVAMATDLAEFIGAAVGLKLLFRMPFPVAALVTAIVALAVLSLQRRGHRPFEIAVTASILLIGAGFAYLTFRVPPSGAGLVSGLRPSLRGDDTLLLAVGIIGATVMPHAIYLHSGLTSGRIDVRSVGERVRLLRVGRADIVVAMGLAGLVNLSMLAVAAQIFRPSSTTLTLESVHSGLAQAVGGGAALAFAVALLASGISSASVGTAAGQIIMDGFLARTSRLWLRRTVTMLPAIAVLCSGTDPTQVLILSQVVLSFGIPPALIALTVLTGRRSVMGEHANTRRTTALMIVITGVLSTLNAVVVILQFL